MGSRNPRGIVLDWLTPKISIQLSYRHIKVGNKLIPNGGTVNDASVRAEDWILPAIDASAFAQYERCQFPLLATGLHKILRFVSPLSKTRGSKLLCHCNLHAPRFHLESGNVVRGRGKQRKETRVTDLIFTLVTIGFFVIAIGYLRGCERLK